MKKQKADQDIVLMKKFAQRTTKLTPEMVDQAKLLLDALGIPWVQAPSEGEAQAAYMAKKGDVDGAISQGLRHITIRNTSSLSKPFSIFKKKRCQVS